MFPLFKLKKSYYHVNAKSRFISSPLNVPSRTKRVWIGLIFDWLLILAMFGISQWFFLVPKPPVAYFRVDDEDYMRPEIPEIISSGVAGFLSGGVPLIILLILQVLFFWNKWDLYHMVTGHATSVAFSLVFTSLFWITVGSHLGLRPYFLTKCQPDVHRLSPDIIYYTADICTQPLKKFDFQGFPSGHASNAFAGWVFFVLYLNSKLKPWNGTAYVWKGLVLTLPLALATWVALTRVRDFRHFPFQIILGSLIGIASAILSYRLNFVVFGWFLGPGDGNDHIPARYQYLAAKKDVPNANGTGKREVEEVTQAHNPAATQMV
ncbi:2042_t:CDS:2 [Paraglomus occultum]|uniref:2042_t:CDS:1 n=1 Tax=Paraglomus occultum TaxID=144539 RepID=A0A9N8ZM78_9GLOM|nr:2042_t:CDS:2 [Paraglomus occultum]